MEDISELTDSVISGDFGPISALASVEGIEKAKINSLIFDQN
jgi:hypothetical protein